MSPHRIRPHGQLPHPPELDGDQAVALRERMLAEVGALGSEDGAADWVHKNLSAKNALSDDDAELVEARFREKLAMIASTSEANNALAIPVTDTSASHVPQTGLPNEDSAVARASSQAQLARPVTTKPIRLRDKEHCRFVATQPCIICGRSPSETHHIRYAQPRAMSRRVSDEYTVPVCRLHHRELHRYGDEASWWAGVSIDPQAVALALWRQSHPNLAPENEKATTPAAG
jgi:hypothetical protein